VGAAVSPIRLVGAVGTETARADSDREVGLSTLGDRWEAGFTGRVVDDRDQPLAGALVVALPAATSARPAGTDGDSVPPPRTAERGGWPGRLRGWWPGAARGEGRPGQALAAPSNGQAVHEPGPLAGALPLVASTRADGRFVLPAVPPGRYLLFAIHAGPPPATSDALVVDGRSLTVPLRLVITRGAHLL
jgi:hypothetical protein